MMNSNDYSFYREIDASPQCLPFGLRRAAVKDLEGLNISCSNYSFVEDLHGCKNQTPAPMKRQSHKVIIMCPVSLKAHGLGTF